MADAFSRAAQSYLEALASCLEEVDIDVDVQEFSLSFSVGDEEVPYLLKVHQGRQEIWLSSPTRGGHRFAWTPHHPDVWVSQRHLEALDAFLREDLRTKGIVV
jgi:frataxin-like iron-binding protein CyaY